MKTVDKKTKMITPVSDKDLVLVEKLSPVDHVEVHVGGGVVKTHNAVTKSHHEVETEDDDENEDDDDGHGACGQDGLRAERTDHTETSLTGDDGRHDLGHPREAEETHQVVVRDELEHRSKSVLVGGHEVVETVGKLCIVQLHSSS